MTTEKRESFEVGPIRPPNEADSLLVRVSRNCPWNRCTFCPVYKQDRFTLRQVDEVEADIRAMAALAQEVEDWLSTGEKNESLASMMQSGSRVSETYQVVRFVQAGSKTAFLQDANSLIMPVDQLERVLSCLRESFPALERVTSYARSHTLTKRTVEELVRLREAGLDRIHIGLESGSDDVLERVQKGVTAERQIEAGKRVKSAGIELSEYIMPGLGGADLSKEHAKETARVLRAIDPHFIRLRTLAVPPGSPLAEDLENGSFKPLDDIGIVREIRALIAGLEGMTSVVQSDHILNLLEEVQGELPADRERMLDLLDRFLDLPEEERDTFIVGRRIGVFRRLSDLEHPPARDRAIAAKKQIEQYFPSRISEGIREMMTRFI